MEFLNWPNAAHKLPDFRLRVGPSLLAHLAPGRATGVLFSEVTQLPDDLRKPPPHRRARILHRRHSAGYFATWDELVVEPAAQALTEHFAGNARFKTLQLPRPIHAVPDRPENGRPLAAHDILAAAVK